MLNFEQLRTLIFVKKGAEIFFRFCLLVAFVTLSTFHGITRQFLFPPCTETKFIQLKFLETKFIQLRFLENVRIFKNNKRDAMEF